MTTLVILAAICAAFVALVLWRVLSEAKRLDQLPTTESQYVYYSKGVLYVPVEMVAGLVRRGAVRTDELGRLYSESTGLLIVAQAEEDDA